MRTIDNNAIAAAAAIRFRSEYDYALFEYLRSAKVIEALERAGVKLHGRILDDGCGGGGTVLSLAEEARFAIGLDLKPRFRDAGTRLARERAIGNAAFVCGDGTRLPLRAGTFDLVFSHSVIEHVSSAEEYLRECHRVLRPQGILYLSTAPYLSFAGAHLPRLRIPIPIHILFGRRVAFRTFCLLGRHASWLLKEARDSNTFVALAEQNEKKHDDLAQRVTVKRLAGWIQHTGFTPLSFEQHITGFFRAWPRVVQRLFRHLPLIKDASVGHIQCVLQKV